MQEIFLHISFSSYLCRKHESCTCRKKFKMCRKFSRHTKKLSTCVGNFLKFACHGRKFFTGVGRILNFTSCVGSMIPALSPYISIGFLNYIGRCYSHIRLGDWVSKEYIVYNLLKLLYRSLTFNQERESFAPPIGPSFMIT